MQPMMKQAGTRSPRQTVHGFAAAGEPSHVGSDTVSDWSGDQPPAGGESGPTADVAFRQLRLRYDRLRSDYESLLDRIGELENRIQTASSSAEPRVRGRLATALAEPLLELRLEYMEAADSIQGIVRGLNDLVGRGMKGQHQAPAQPDLQPTAPAPQGPDIIEIAVEGGDFGDLLDFQQQLSHLDRVAQVSIRSLDQDRATLLVELHKRDS